MGGQIGLISGGIAGIRTLQGTPNAKRILELLRDVQLSSSFFFFFTFALGIMNFTF